MHIEHLSIGYGTRTLLSDVTLTLEGGQLVALLGRNGTGKSTLLRALAGLEPCRTGEVWLDGRPLSTLDAGERSRRVHELVAMGRAPYTNWVGRLSATDEAAIARALELTGMSAYASRPTDSLSDGESQRVMIARALAQDTPLVLLDEPTSFLDLPNRYDLCLLLKRLATESGKLIVFSTHELDIALSVCHTVMLIDNPRVHCLPTPEMVSAGHIERLFHSPSVSFDISEWEPGSYAVRVKGRG